jgi:SAM-dependent methyltransferase
VRYGRPSEMNEPIVTRHYTGERGACYLARNQKLMDFHAVLTTGHFQPYIVPGDSVVDFGCGVGAVLAGLDAERKLGVEINESARAAAAARGVQTVGSTDELPDASADVVISHHALEHTAEPLRELRGLRRVLRPGGRLILWLPLDDWRTQRRPAEDHNHHLYAWTPLLLGNLLAEAGFEVQESRIVTYTWPPRIYRQLWRLLPRPAFDLFARACAVLLRRRQLMAVAVRPPEP